MFRKYFWIIIREILRKNCWRFSRMIFWNILSREATSKFLKNLNNTWEIYKINTIRVYITNLWRLIRRNLWRIFWIDSWRIPKRKSCTFKTVQKVLQVGLQEVFLKQPLLTFESTSWILVWRMHGVFLERIPGGFPKRSSERFSQSGVISKMTFRRATGISVELA